MSLLLLNLEPTKKGLSVEVSLKNGEKFTFIHTAGMGVREFNAGDVDTLLSMINQKALRILTEKGLRDKAVYL